MGHRVRWRRLQFHGKFRTAQSGRRGRNDRMSRFALSSRAKFVAIAAAAALAAVAASASRLAAFERVQAPPAAKPEMVENCPGLVAADRPRIIPAAFKLALNSDQVRLTYVGHSTFLLESPQLVRVATDYNDYVRSPVRPDIVTMNHAHTTHFTDYPDPAIKYVLRGWGPTPA